jgi:hypothetical protein
MSRLGQCCGRGLQCVGVGVRIFLNLLGVGDGRFDCGLVFIRQRLAIVGQ